MLAVVLEKLLLRMLNVKTTFLGLKGNLSPRRSLVRVVHKEHNVNQIKELLKHRKCLNFSNNGCAQCKWSR